MVWLRWLYWCCGCDSDGCSGSCDVGGGTSGGGGGYIREILLCSVIRIVPVLVQ